MSTYASLTQDIQDWTENDDTEFTDETDNFIAFAEERIFRDAPFLPIFKGTDTGTMSSSTESITIATTTRTIRSMTITVSSSEVTLHQRLDSYLRDYAPATATTGTPKYYARTNETTVIVAPVPDSNYAYTLTVTKQPTGLSGSNTTSWLSGNMSDLLLFACMIEAMTFIKNPEGLAMWEARYGTALNSVQNEMGRNIGHESTVGA
jgi:hypothetical protein